MNFNHSYNRATWQQFLSKTFNQTIQLAASPTPQALTNTQTVQKLYYLGYIQLADGNRVELYEAQLAPTVILERNRVGVRNALRSYWKNAANALFVYHDPQNLLQWRISFISYDSISQQSTEPKRYTYLLGENETTKTTEQRFNTLNSNSTLNDFLNAFAVEPVSKDFFGKYKDHYQQFCDYIISNPSLYTLFPNTNDKPKTVRDFCKKLLGRLIFLYFVQKKGWLNNDLDFLYNQFLFFKNNGQAELFYNDFLCPLFFETLNTPPQDRKTNVITNQKFNIPYLNGGLFEQDSTDLYLSKSTLIIGDYQPKTTKSKSKNSPAFAFDPLNLFETFFNTLNSYNFTIYEDDPNDHTVAIDPEMLGHIFENLLEDNKEKGAFYTPKAIVQYMCQQSLIQYLQTACPTVSLSIITNLIQQQNTDNLPLASIPQLTIALQNVRICDPAIGSGAFPMGLLQEIFNAFQLLHDAQKTPNIPFNRAQVKLNIIQNSIYGVDIEQGAVDIARLRFWLSLIVDEDQAQPLPNLDYKIVVGNTLVPKFNDIVLNIDWKAQPQQLFETSFKDKQQQLLKNLNQLQTQFFSFTTTIPKSNLIAEIRKVKIQLLITQLELLIETQGIHIAPTGRNKSILIQTERFLETQNWKKALATLKTLLSNNQPLQFFDWQLSFPEILNTNLNPNAGFHIVIGNPPYVQIQNLKEQQADFESQKFQVYSKSSDIYALFYEKGHKLLAPNGHLCFITSNKWMRAAYGESLREYFATQTTTLSLIDFAGVQIFENATVDTNILLLQNAKPQPNHLTQAYVFKAGEKIAQNGLVKSSLLPIHFPPKDSWVVLNPIEQQIKRKIEQLGTPLKDWDVSIYRGILTGYNEAFIIDEAKRKELIEKSPNSADLIRPLLRGRDIKKWKADFVGLYLICVPCGWTNQNNKNKQNPEIFFKTFYPAVYQHLVEMATPKEKKITGKGLYKRDDQGDYWWELRSCGYMDDFYKDKIIYPNMTKFLPFVYDTKQYITNQKAFIIVGKQLNYLVSFLNSPLFNQVFKNNFPELLGGTRELSKIFFEQIPIKLIDEAQEKKFTKLVTKISLLKEKNGDISAVENEINHLLYKQYNLNDVEIAFLENSIQITHFFDDEPIED